MLVVCTRAKVVFWEARFIWFVVRYQYTYYYTQLYLLCYAWFFVVELP